LVLGVSGHQQIRMDSGLAFAAFDGIGMPNKLLPLHSYARDMLNERCVYIMSNNTTEALAIAIS